MKEKPNPPTYRGNVNYNTPMNSKILVSVHRKGRSRLHEPYFLLSIDLKIIGNSLGPMPRELYLEGQSNFC